MALGLPRPLDFLALVERQAAVATADGWVCRPRQELAAVPAAQGVEDTLAASAPAADILVVAVVVRRRSAGRQMRLGSVSCCVDSAVHSRSLQRSSVGSRGRAATCRCRHVQSALYLNCGVLSDWAERTLVDPSQVVWVVSPTCQGARSRRRAASAVLLLMLTQRLQLHPQAMAMVDLVL